LTLKFDVKPLLTRGLPHLKKLVEGREQFGLEIGVL
jgi:hypothetical protein